MISFSWGIRPDLVVRAHDGRPGGADPGGVGRGGATRRGRRRRRHHRAGDRGRRPRRRGAAAARADRAGHRAGGPDHRGRRHRRRAGGDAARDAGARAVAAGTAFLVAEEADRHPGYVERLLAADETILTDVFSIGWPKAKHRVLPNEALAAGVPAPDAMPTGPAEATPRRWRSTPALASAGCTPSSPQQRSSPALHSHHEACDRDHGLRRAECALGCLGRAGGGDPARLREHGRGGGRPRAARAAERGGDRRDARLRSTASSSPAAPTSTPRSTATSSIRRRTGRGRSATAASWRCCARRSSATCRCSPSAAARRC